MTDSRCAIKIDNLKKSFGSKVILDGVDLEVAKGESLVIIGGSGTGKSVTIKSILGLLQPDSGSIKINGEDILALKPREKAKVLDKIGMLFQGGALFDSITVWENVAFKLLNKKNIKRDEAKTIALQKLKAVGLPENVAELKPSELSGGMQKRASLARSIASKPEIIFFDEPTTGLDPIMSDVINSLIVNLSKELGATTLTITHDMTSARKIADKIAMLYNGKIIWHGDAKDIDNSGNKYVEQFITGSSQGPIKL